MADPMSLRGAQDLKEKILDYWTSTAERRRKYGSFLAVDIIRVNPFMRNTYAVRSNMKNGYPPHKKEKQDG